VVASGGGASGIAGCAGRTDGTSDVPRPPYAEVDVSLSGPDGRGTDDSALLGTSPRPAGLAAEIMPTGKGWAWRAAAQKRPQAGTTAQADSRRFVKAEKDFIPTKVMFIDAPQGILPASAHCLEPA